MFGKRSVTGAEVRGAPAAPARMTTAPAAQAPPTPVDGDGGGRNAFPSAGLAAPLVPAPVPQAGRVVGANHQPAPPGASDARRSDTYYEVKGAIFGALIEAIDLAQLAKLDADSARE